MSSDNKNNLKRQNQYVFQMYSNYNLQNPYKYLSFKKKKNIYSLENSCMVVAEAWLMHSDMTLSQTPLRRQNDFLLA